MSLNAIWNEIFSKYGVSGNCDDGARNQPELLMLEKILPLIEKQIDDRYEITAALGKGGAGLVLRVQDRILEVARALKCARPVAGKEPILTQIMASEISKLRGLSHENVVSVFYFGSVEFDKIDWPFYIMEFIEGGVDCYDYLQTNKLVERDLISLIYQLVSGVSHLHERKLLHGDIKLENALVSPDNKVKLSDLGSARYLSTDPTETTVTYTKDFAHPILRGFATSDPTDPNRVQIDLARSKLQYRFDIYALGKNIIRILDIIDFEDIETLSYYSRAYLHLLAARCLDGLNMGAKEQPDDLPQSAFGELKYEQIKDIQLDLEKLTGEYNLAVRIPELDTYSPNSLQISYPGTCPLTTRLASLLESYPIKRLGDISQLGLMVLVYPTATHSRLEHSLGTYSSTIRYCSALWNDPINPIFRQIIGENDIRALLCAAICHDMGQYGLAHDFEEANKEVFSHSRLTTGILRGHVGGDHAERLRTTLQKEWNVDPDYVAQILEANPTDLDEALIPRLLHTIIDGPVDADKVDYLVRDSRKVGVPYGDGLDISRLLRCLTVVAKREGQKTFVSIGVYEKAKIAAEAIAFARYAMFGCVYWHHSTRAAKSMLHRATWEALPIIDKRRREYTEFLDEFEKFVMSEYADTAQKSLFPEDRILLHNPVLSVGDVRALNWLHGRTTQQGKELLEMIVNRELFKRLIVVSNRLKRSLWEQLQKIRVRVDHRTFMSFQRDVQNELVQMLHDTDLEELRKTKTITTPITADRVGEIVSRNAGYGIIILVDIPPERPGSRLDLQFLAEERVKGARRLGRVAPALEESVVWEAISGGFLESVGKIRVFVHRKYILEFEELLSREAVEGVLGSSARKYMT